MNAILILMIIWGGIWGLARIGKWAGNNPGQAKAGMELFRQIFRK